MIERKVSPDSSANVDHVTDPSEETGARRLDENGAGCSVKNGAGRSEENGVEAKNGVERKRTEPEPEDDYDYNDSGTMRILKSS